MNRLLSIIFTVFVGGPLLAQYIPVSGQPFQFAQAYNPAFAGIESFNDLKFGYRYQWSGFPGAPKTALLSYSTRIKNPLELSLHSLRSSNSEADLSSSIPTGKRILQGLGFTIYHESAGEKRNIGGIMSYSFNYPVSKKIRLAGGLGVNIDRSEFRFDRLSLRDPDHFIDELQNSYKPQTNLSIRTGLLIYAERFYFGISYLPILSKDIQSSETTLSQDVFYNLTTQAGFSVRLSEAVQIKPSFMVLGESNNDFSFDYNLKVYIQDNVWFGFTYRDVKTVTALMGFNLNGFGISYAYEISVSGFKQFHDGSHDLILSYRFKNFRRLKPFLW